MHFHLYRLHYGVYLASERGGPAKFLDGLLALVFSLLVAGVGGNLAVHAVKSHKGGDGKPGKGDDGSDAVLPSLEFLVPQIPVKRDPTAAIMTMSATNANVM